MPPPTTTDNNKIQLLLFLCLLFPRVAFIIRIIKVIALTLVWSGRMVHVLCLGSDLYISPNPCSSFVLSILELSAGAPGSVADGHPKVLAAIFDVNDDGEKKWVEELWAGGEEELRKMEPLVIINCVHSGIYSWIVWGWNERE